MRQKCIDQMTPPVIQPGDTIDHGEFFRNLRKEHVAKRYDDGDEDRPEYGYKLHKGQWGYWDRQHSGLSANLRSCIHSEVCSIALHPDPDNYFHVALIDLAAINRCGLLSCSFVAQCKPEWPNMCHFVIVPLDGVVTKWMELGTALDDLFPPVKKLPTNAEEKAQARTAYEKHRSLVDIRCWVRKRDGSLS
jgi:hypothetical protein